jgi:hypothetical protein
MDELDNLDIYNGDTEHDMWVDFTYHIDYFINNLNDWD